MTKRVRGCSPSHTILAQLAESPATITKLSENTDVCYETIREHLYKMIELGLVKISGKLALEERGRPQWIYDIGPKLRGK